MPQKIMTKYEILVTEYDQTGYFYRKHRTKQTVITDTTDSVDAATKKAIARTPLKENDSDWDQKTEVLSAEDIVIALELAERLDEPEKVVLPDFVFNHLEKYKDKGLSLWVALGNGVDFELKLWMTGPNQELYARAWLAYPNIEVEKEQKYRVENDESPLLIKVKGKIRQYNDMTYYGHIEHTFELTEEEIKEYDERYWAFAVKVEELEK